MITRFTRSAAERRNTTPRPSAASFAWTGPLHVGDVFRPSWQVRQLASAAWIQEEKALIRGHAPQWAEPAGEWIEGGQGLIPVSCRVNRALGVQLIVIGLINSFLRVVLPSLCDGGWRGHRPDQPGLVGLQDESADVREVRRWGELCGTLRSSLMDAHPGRRRWPWGVGFPSRLFSSLVKTTTSKSWAEMSFL